jgi:hypothetical protein
VNDNAVEAVVDKRQQIAGKRPTIHVCHIIVADDMFAL